MRKIEKITLTLVCGALLLFFVDWVNQLIGRGQERNHFLLFAYFGLGFLSLIATGIYLKGKGVDLADSAAIWLPTVAISGGLLILIWPLMLPILIWSETILTRILKKNYFPTSESLDAKPRPVDRMLSDEEKLEAMRKLVKRSR